MKKIKQIQNKLKDERCQKVIFLSHCLLNMNARYLGGAFRSTCISEVIRGAVERNIAMIQMKCPEQQVWGGILKPLMWLAFGCRKTLLFQMRALFLPGFLLYTRIRYRQLAQAVVREICDYERAGCEVIGIVGIDGSPTCGVNLRINMNKAFHLYAGGSISVLDREDFNKSLYDTCLSAGSGIFIDEIKTDLRRKGKNVPLYSHSLLDEMDQKTVSIWEGIQ